MSPQIKLTVTKHDKLIQTVTKTVEKQHLIKSLKEFQLEANAALTKMIAELGDIGDTIGDANMDEDEDEDDQDTDDDGESSPSTGKKSNRHSESKKKKHN